MKEFVGSIVAMFLIVTLGVFFVVRIAMVLLEPNSVTCMVGKDVVYCGPAYGVTVESTGSTTKLLVYGSGFFDFQLKSAYVGKEVSVNPTN